jgi:glucose-1-phosphate cytidylyltransferase
MKIVILAGGLGTRLGEETQLRPKPMVEIGAIPILVHLMRSYASFGFNDFVVALGYKGDVIKDYFLNYHLRNSDLKIKLGTGKIKFDRRVVEDWTVQLADTGEKCMTGGRLRRLSSSLRTKGTFMLTYGDGLSDVDIRSLLSFHRGHGKLATVTAVHPPARFGTMVFAGDRVTDFKEKPQAGGGWINGGFFVFEPDVFDYLQDDATILEKEPLENLASDGQLMAYRHHGFWQPMDTLRDKEMLNELWRAGNAPWLPRKKSS